MEYDALVAKVIELLQREKRVPYRVLKRRFDLADDYVEDLKIDLIEAKQLAMDENDRILVWIGEAGSAEASTPPQLRQHQNTLLLLPQTEHTNPCPIPPDTLSRRF